MLEQKLQCKIISFCRERAIFVRAVEWRGRVGCPDLVLMKNGAVVWIEVKQPKGRLRPAQVREIERIKQHGVQVYVVRSIKDVERIYQTTALGNPGAAQQPDVDSP